MSREVTGPLKSLLEQLKLLLTELPDSLYCKSITALSGASIGEHTRHVIEFFTELDRNYEAGEVNYDLRKRDRQIETDRGHAIAALKNIFDNVDKKNKPLWLATNFSSDGQSAHLVATNYERELIYNMEHIVHHMALMRIGVMTVSDIILPEMFGVAVSTQRHRNQTTS